MHPGGAYHPKINGGNFASGKFMSQKEVRHAQAPDLSKKHKMHPTIFNTAASVNTHKRDQRWLVIRRDGGWR